MAGGGLIVGTVVAFVGLTLGLLAFALFMPIGVPFLGDIITSDISPFGVFLWSVVPFFTVIALIFKVMG